MIKRLLAIVFVFLSSLVMATSWPISEAEYIIDGKANFVNVQPGDTLILEGQKNILIIRNLKGTPENPIVITNKAGRIFSINSTAGFGISIQGCSHIRLVGRPINKVCGIQVTVPNGVGVGVGYFSENWEINGLEIGPTKAPGILAKTDPDCSFTSTRDKFTQQGGKILSCYIHDTGTEGIYFGSSAYNGLSVRCGNEDTLLMPHLIYNAEVAHNLVKNTGWDAIQIASTLNSSVHHNTVINDSKVEQRSHMNGIIAGLGFSGHIYNNLILNGNGNGIFSMARDSLIIDNNIIINPGYASSNGGQYGIFLNLESEESKWLQVNNNLIANPRYQAFHSSLHPNMEYAGFINNIISYNDSLTGNSQELISSPLTALSELASNHINTEINLNQYYYNKDSLDQRNNGFTTNSGILPLFVNSVDFYNRPRIDNSGIIDMGPFEYHDVSTAINSYSISNQPCIEDFLSILQGSNAQSLQIISLNGQILEGADWAKLPRGLYIIREPQGTCSIPIYKSY